MNKRLASGVALGALAVVVIGTGVWQTQLERMPTGQEAATAVENDIVPVEDFIAHESAPVGNLAQAPERKAAPKPEPFAAGDAGMAMASPPPSAVRAKRQARADVQSYSGAGAPLMEMQANRAVAPGMAPGFMPPHPIDPPMVIEEGRDRFAGKQPNALKITAEEPVSTFSIDVDTASYSFVRRLLNQGQLPAPEMVRIEEMVNYFDYAYPAPQAGEAPFKPTVEIYPTPWNAKTKLVHIGLQGRESEIRPKANLVFLVDVSGSMAEPDKLPLLKNALRMMVENLNPEDSVALVTYAGNSGVALEPTRVKDKAAIFSALDSLGAGGSTAGAQGIEAAYQLAEKHLDKEGINRVILATDGDFNVGQSSPEELRKLIERKREGGVSLSVLGFGRGNYHDALMQSLAQHGNGQAAYIDTLNEARKVLVEEASSTLFTIAKDVKIQVEFNPETVAEYRLIGYETRHLERQDFNNDKVDAGEIGSGHQVTAIYEITPKGSGGELVDPLRYGQPAKPVTQDGAGEYGFLKLRYKQPDASKSQLLTLPITPAREKRDLASVPADLRFAAAIAAFGQKLRGESAVSDYSYADLIKLAVESKGEDSFGYRAEAINLMRLAESIRK